MSKSYELESSDNIDESVRIKVTETKEVETSVSVDDLKRRIESFVSEIDRLKEQHDLTVDEITAIDLDETINLTVKDIPTKLIIK